MATEQSSQNRKKVNRNKEVDFHFVLDKLSEFNRDQLLKIEKEILRMLYPEQESQPVNWFNNSSSNPFSKLQARDPVQIQKTQNLLMKRLTQSPNQSFQLSSSNAISDVSSYAKVMQLQQEEIEAIREIETELKTLNTKSPPTIEQVLFKCDKIAINAQAISPQDIQEMNSSSKARQKELTNEVKNHTLQQQQDVLQSKSIALLGILSIYLEKGFQVRLKGSEEVTNSSKQTKKQSSQQQSNEQDNPIYRYQKQLVSTGQMSGIGYFNFGAEFNNSSSEIPTREEACSMIKEDFWSSYGIEPNQVVVLDLAVSQEVRGVAGSIRLPENLMSHIKRSQQKDANEIDQKFGMFQHFKNIHLKFTSLIDHFQLSEDLFDSKYNNQWPKSQFQHNISYRGALNFKGKGIQKQRYYMPIDWQGFGLNMKNLIEQDKSEWFSMNDNINTWIVLYHGTKGSCIKGIFDSKNEIKPGYNNACGSTLCRITQQMIPAGSYENTYLAENVQESQVYCDQPGYRFGDRKFQFIFQCRVNPLHLRSPSHKKEYYVVEKLFAKESIRPYRLLVREIKS